MSDSEPQTSAGGTYGQLVPRLACLRIGKPALKDHKDPTDAKTGEALQVMAGARESGEPPCHINSNELAVLLKEVTSFEYDNINRLNALSDTELYHYVRARLPRFDGVTLASFAGLCDTALNISKIGRRFERAVNTVLLVKARHRRIQAKKVVQEPGKHRFAIRDWSTYVQIWIICHSQADDFASSKDEPIPAEARRYMLALIEGPDRTPECPRDSNGSDFSSVAVEHEFMMDLWRGLEKSLAIRTKAQQNQGVGRS